MNPGFNAPFAPMNPFMPPQQFGANFKTGGPQNSNLLTLYIGDLEEQISEEFLYPYFSKFGPIYSLKIMRDRYLRKSRGFGFITYYNIKDGNFLYFLNKFTLFFISRNRQGCRQP